eukprot:scaffold105158_cov54-Phaeocystis_antarctica.AAC.1
MGSVELLSMSIGSTVPKGRVRSGTLDGAADTRCDGVDALGNHVDGSRDAVPVRASSKECRAARETDRHTRRINGSADPSGSYRLEWRVASTPVRRADGGSSANSEENSCLGFGVQQRGRVASDGAKGRAEGAKGRPRQAPSAQGKHVMR